MKLPERTKGDLALMTWGQHYKQLLGEEPDYLHYKKRPKHRRPRTKKFIDRLCENTKQPKSVVHRSLDYLESIRPGADRVGGVRMHKLDLPPAHRIFRTVHPYALLRAARKISMNQMVTKMGKGSGYTGHFYEQEVKPPRQFPRLSLLTEVSRLFNVNLEELAYDVMVWWRCREHYREGDPGALQRWIEHIGAVEDMEDDYLKGATGDETPDDRGE